MASWIGATDSQRFWQYIVPAARKAVADGGWVDTEMATLVAQGEALKAKMADMEEGSFEHRQSARRLASLRDCWVGYSRQRKIDLATLAEADRRKAYRKGKAA